MSQRDQSQRPRRPIQIKPATPAMEAIDRPPPRFYPERESPSTPPAGSRRNAPRRAPGNTPRLQPATVVIHREAHFLPQWREMRENLIARGGRGEIHLGVEGHDFDDPENTAYWVGCHGADPERCRINGLEDDFAHSLTTAPTIACAIHLGVRRMHGEEQRLEMNKQAFLLQLARDSFAPAAWRRVRRPFQDPQAEALARQIDQLVQLDRSMSEAQRGANQVKRSPVWRADQAFDTVATAYARAMGELAKAEYADKVKLPDMELYERFLGDLSNSRLEAQFAKEICISWRSPFNLTNVVKLSQRAAAEGKPLHIIVGGLHVKPMETGLRAVLPAGSSVSAPRSR